MVQDNTPHVSSDLSEEALKERRYFWMARAFAVVCVVSFITNIILIIGLFSLVPTVRVQPFYLNLQDKNEQVISIRRSNNLNLDTALLTESLIRQYLLARLTIGSDTKELEARWGLDGAVNWTSESSVFGMFAETAQALIEQARKEGLTRRVDILSVVKLREADASRRCVAGRIESGGYEARFNRTVDNALAGVDGGGISPQPRRVKVVSTLEKSDWVHNYPVRDATN